MLLQALDKACYDMDYIAPGLNSENRLMAEFIKHKSKYDE